MKNLLEKEYFGVLIDKLNKFSSFRVSLDIHKNKKIGIKVVIRNYREERDKLFFLSFPITNIRLKEFERWIDYLLLEIW